MLEFINLPDGKLPPVAPYSHAVRAGDFLFVTGQLAEDPETGEVVKGSIEAQTEQVMSNLRLVLEHADTSFENVVMSRWHLRHRLSLLRNCEPDLCQLFYSGPVSRTDYCWGDGPGWIWGC